MRISDWSSDVCSSDLHGDDAVVGLGRDEHLEIEDIAGKQDIEDLATAVLERLEPRRPAFAHHQHGVHFLAGGDDFAVGAEVADSAAQRCQIGPVGIVEIAVETRSEEHTSELQSLMRNSYAVFCLKKK